MPQHQNTLLNLRVLRMEKIKSFNVRIPHSLWIAIKKEAIDREVSLNQIVIECLQKYKEEIEKSKK